MGRGLSEEAERRERAQILRYFGEVPHILGWCPESPCDPEETGGVSVCFQAVQNSAFPAFWLEPSLWRWPGNNFQYHSVAGCCGTRHSNKCSLCLHQQVYGNANPGIFSYLFKVQTSHYSFWVWGTEWMGGKATNCFIPRTAARSVAVSCHLKTSALPAVSRGINRLPTSFLKHRATWTFPLQLLQILWKITETSFYMIATHTHKKETHYTTCNHSLWENKSQWVVLSFLSTQDNEGTEYMPWEFKSEFTSTMLLKNFEIHCKMLPGVFVASKITLTILS